MKDSIVSRDPRLFNPRGEFITARMVEKSADGRRSRAARTKASGRSGRRHLAMLNDWERCQAVDGVGYCPRG